MINTVMIILAKYFYLSIPVVYFIYFLTDKRNTKKQITIFSLITLLFSFLAAKTAGFLFYNPRPFVVNHFTPLITHASNNGFPSDHALLSFALAFLVFVFNRKLGLILVVFGIIVGFARIYTGVHSIVDVLGSFIISGSVTFASYSFFKNKKIIRVN